MGQGVACARKSRWMKAHGGPCQGPEVIFVVGILFPSIEEAKLSFLLLHHFLVLVSQLWTGLFWGELDLDIKATPDLSPHLLMKAEDIVVPLFMNERFRELHAEVVNMKVDNLEVVSLYVINS